MAFGHIEDGNMLIHLLQLDKKLLNIFWENYA